MIESGIEKCHDELSEGIVLLKNDLSTLICVDIRLDFWKFF